MHEKLNQFRESVACGLEHKVTGLARIETFRNAGEERAVSRPEPGARVFLQFWLGEKKREREGWFRKWEWQIRGAPVGFGQPYIGDGQRMREGADMGG